MRIRKFRVLISTQLRSRAFKDKIFSLSPGLFVVSQLINLVAQRCLGVLPPTMLDSFLLGKTSALDSERFGIFLCALENADECTVSVAPRRLVIIVILRLYTRNYSQPLLETRIMVNIKEGKFGKPEFICR